MIIYTITEEYQHYYTYSPCQDVISMHKVDLSSRCLLMKKKVCRRWKIAKELPSTITLPIDFQVNLCVACSTMNGECYDDYNVAAKRTAA